MILKKIPEVLVFILFVMLNSCLLNSTTNFKTLDESLEVKWEVDVSPESSREMLVIENIGYIRETASGGLAAINLDDGTIKWRVSSAFRSQSNPVLVGGYIALLAQIGTHLYLINPEDGTIEKKVHISVDGETEYTADGLNNLINTGYYILSNGSNLYWGTLANYTTDNKPLGLVSIDINSDIVMDENGEYWGKVDVIYESDSSYSEQITNKVYIDNNILYFGSNSEDWHINWRPKYKAMDLISKNILWEIEPNQLFGGGSFAINNFDEYIFLSEKGYGLINKVTGELLYEVSPGSGGYCGGFIRNNLFYSTNRSTSGSILDKDSIQCVNILNGKQIWGYSVSLSLSSRPVVYEDYLFVAAQDELKVLNAETGAFLGGSNSVNGGFNQLNHNFLYNNRYMIIDGDSKVFCIDLESTVSRMK